MEKTNKTQEILELLKEKELTTSEIQDELGYDLNLIQVIIHRLKNDYKKIKKIGKKGKFTIYKAIDTDLYENTMNNRIIHDKIDKLENEKQQLRTKLIFLNDFFKNSIELLMKDGETISYITKNEQTFNEIEELIK